MGGATKRLGSVPQGPDHSRQNPGEEHGKDNNLCPGSQTVSRRQTIDEGLKYVLVHNADLLIRLADA
jgi:hypothetical protein